MGTLFVDRQNCALELSGSVLTVRVPGETPRTLPAALIERVVLRADTQLSSGTLAGLSAQGIGMLALGGRRGDRLAAIVGSPARDVRLRITQVRRLDDETFCSQWSCALVCAKLKSQRRLLARAQRERPDLRKPLFDALATLDSCINKVEGDNPVEVLRGIEGAGAAAYFRGYTTLFADSLQFTKRQRRPPTDPVNACLSLGYTLLYGLAVESCHVRGLDPMLGYLHVPAYGRASLACDVMEPCRVHVDALVWKLFRTRTLEGTHFGREGSGACLLGKAGRSTFYAAWAEHSRKLSRTMGRYARMTVRALGDLAPEFAAEDEAAWN